MYLHWSEGIGRIMGVRGDRRGVHFAAGSCGGKDHVAKKFAKALASQCTTSSLVSHDMCYVGRDNMPDDNYDHPTAQDSALIVKLETELLNGQTVHMPIYDFARHRRSDKTVPIDPGEVVIGYGNFALREEFMPDAGILKVFIRASVPIRFSRRVVRDMQPPPVGRSRTYEDICAQWNETVVPMYERFIAPQEREADIVLLNDRWLPDPPLGYTVPMNPPNL